MKHFMFLVVLGSVALVGCASKNPAGMSDTSVRRAQEAARYQADIVNVQLTNKGQPPLTPEAYQKVQEDYMTHYYAGVTNAISAKTAANTVRNSGPQELGRLYRDNRIRTDNYYGNK